MEQVTGKLRNQGNQRNKSRRKIEVLQRCIPQNVIVSQIKCIIFTEIVCVQKLCLQKQIN